MMKWLDIDGISHWMSRPERPDGIGRPEVEHQKTDNPSIKTVVYEFINLPWIRRLDILIKLYLLDEEDREARHVDILEKIMAKVKECNCMDAFWREIKLAQNDGAEPPKEGTK